MIQSFTNKDVYFRIKGQRPLYTVIDHTHMLIRVWPGVHLNDTYSSKL